MIWLKKFPWLSLTLLLLTYSAFGWLVSQSIPFWLVKQGWYSSLSSAEKVVWWSGELLVLLTVLVLIAPLKLIKICFGSWLQSDTKAFISVLGWALAAVLIATQIEHFARLLVLIAAELLAHIDLQTAGFPEWQTFIFLALICLTGFGLGVFGFMLWGYS